MINLNLFGVRIRFTFWFFCLWAVLLTIGGSYIYCAVPLLLHELGHLLMIAIFRVKVKEICVSAFAVEIRRIGVSLSLSKELLICLGGIIANLTAAAICYFFSFQSMRAMFFIAVNLAIAALSILPIADIDGGQALELICKRILGRNIAGIVSAAASWLCLTMLIVLFCIMLREGIFNPAPIVLCVYFVRSAAACGTH